MLEKVKELRWTKKTTLTSLALSLAGEELTYGRKDANAVVLVITDGYPISPKRTTDEARQRQNRLKYLAGSCIPMARTLPSSLIPFQSNVDAGLSIGLAIFLRATIFVGRLGNKLE